MIKELYFLASAVICALAVSAWLYQSNQSPALPASAEPAADSGYDQFVDAVQLTQWNTDGQAEHYLLADRMEHFPARQSAVLINPRVHTNANHDPFWIITAGTALLPDTGTIIQLDSQVVLTTRNRSGTKRTLYTEQMQLDTRLNHAYSSLPVRIVSNSGIVAGTGFHANLNTQRMKLHNEVRSRHEERSN